MYPGIRRPSAWINDPYTHNNLGLACFQKGNLDLAIQEFHTASSTWTPTMPRSTSIWDWPALGLAV